jgi:AcrR family transcriptional regulator
VSETDAEFAAPDRRAALKARHRAEILDAARSLIAERGGPTFSVDELADRADLSRRTIFNHFASLDEVVLTLCIELLDVVIDRFAEAAAATPVGDGSPAAIFDELAQALAATDLVGSIAALSRTLGADPTRNGSDARSQQLTQEAFAQVAGRLTHDIARRNPGADPLDIELLVSSLLGGVTVIARHWLIRCGGSVSDESRAEWNALLDHLTDTVRGGYPPA